MESVCGVFAVLTTADDKKIAVGFDDTGPTDAEREARARRELAYQVIKTQCSRFISGVITADLMDGILRLLQEAGCRVEIVVVGVD